MCSPMRSVSRYACLLGSLADFVLHLSSVAHWSQHPGPFQQRSVQAQADSAHTNSITHLGSISTAVDFIGLDNIAFGVIYADWQSRHCRPFMNRAYCMGMPTLTTAWWLLRYGFVLLPNAQHVSPCLQFDFVARA